MSNDKNLDTQRHDLLRADPRREPTIPPEAEKAPSASKSAHPESPQPPARPHSDEDEKKSADRHEAPDEMEPPNDTEKPHPTSVVTNTDPRFEQLEQLVSRGDWTGVLDLLGSPEQAGHLPPNLGLIYALAAKEHDREGGPRKEQSFSATEMAIRCMAGLVGVPENSALSLLLAKRLLRTNPVTWRQAPAPSGKISAIILVLAGIIGGGVGWFLSLGYVSIRLPWFH